MISLNRYQVLTLLALSFICYSCTENKSSDSQEINDNKQVLEVETKQTKSYNNIMSQIFPVSMGEYGYNILINGDTIIHQPHIPSIPGNRGFETQEKARKTAELVIKKIQNNIMPPSVSVEELDSLGVL